MFFGHHILNNMSVEKGIFRGINIYNICKGELFFIIISYGLQVIWLLRI